MGPVRGVYAPKGDAKLSALARTGGPDAIRQRPATRRRPASVSPNARPDAGVGATRSDRGHQCLHPNAQDPARPSHRKPDRCGVQGHPGGPSGLPQAA